MFMKKILLILFFIFCSFLSFSQCNPLSSSDPVTRRALALIIFEKLYEDNLNLNDYEATFFPNPFIDLQDENDINTRIKILSYLQYDNGLTVYNYTNESSTSFKPLTPITKFEALLYFMESWNIEPDFSQNSTPYNDVNALNIDLINGYINAAHDAGIITGNGNWNPFSNITVTEARDILCLILNDSSLHPVNEDLTDTDNYFIPGIYSPENLSQFRGLNQGVFNHYAKNSFVIPDRKMSLNFSHFYSSTMVELPEALYPIKPLGRGWSHTYNAYITRENNVGTNQIDYYYIAWQDGTIHIYNEDDDNYVSNGVYDDLDEISGDRIRITHKDQSRHYFEQLDSNRDIWYLIEIQDANGNEITIEYESAEEEDTRRIEYVEAPSGKKLLFDYTNDTDYIKDITDPIGREIRFDLDEDDDNRLEEFTDAKGNDTDYRYIENDSDAPLQNQMQRFLLDEIRLPRGNKITADYDNNAKLESYQIDDDDPIEVETNFDYENNSITSTVETPIAGSSNPFTEDYTFNENGLVTDYISDTNNIQVVYPSSGVNVLLPTEATKNSVNIEYDYDNDGNVTRIDKENGDIIEEFEYDNDNNLTEYIDGEGNATQFFYDSDENLIEIEDALGNSTLFIYDTYGQLVSKTNQEGITVNYTYESDGAVSLIMAPENISSSFSYDGINRLTERNANGLISSSTYDDNDNITQMTNSGGFQTDYSYDANDNLSSITNPNNVVTSFIYDDEDRVIQEQFGNLITQYDYGDEGYLEEITKPSGQDVDYEYDNDGRLEETGTITDIDYNNRNLVTSITNSSGTMDFDYDNLNRLEEVTTVHGLKVEYDYEDTGTIDDIRYPTINGTELKVFYTYDDKNRVTNVGLIRNVGQDGFIVAEYNYFDDDRIDDIDLGNNTRINCDYDDAGRLDYIEHLELGGRLTLYFSNHTLNPRGNIIQSSQSFTPIPPGFNSGGTGVDIINNTYSYDDNSHITSGNGNDYTVDDDGNTASIDTGIAIVYDIDDRLIDYSDVDNTISFKYNAYNQRVEETRNGITTKYVRDIRTDNILVELDNNNNPIYYYIYNPNGVLMARMKPNGDLHYYHGDIRGSVIMITDDNADITHQYRYDDFGSLTRVFELNNDVNRYRYVGIYGVEYDLDDLYYMRARYYKPSIGRFLTEDPIWSTNLYPYADNNPIIKIDSNGKSANKILDTTIEISAEIAKSNVNYLEQQLIDEYLVTGEFSARTQIMLAGNELWANPWSRNALLFVFTKGRGFSSKAGKFTTKIFGKTGYLKWADMRPTDGRLLKDFGDFIYTESKSQLERSFNKYIEKSYEDN